MRPGRLLAATLIALAAALLAPVAPVEATIVTTRHNLSAAGPGTVKAASEAEICVFCHAPHNAGPSTPLWNRRATGITYTLYSSSTTKAGIGQPTGASLLCLSCHDGTVALGEVLSRAASIPMAGGTLGMPAGTSRLGTDLSDDHPVSFAYNAALVSARGELVSPATLTGAVKLDRSGQMQCTSCHDPHNDLYGKFLVMANTASALCQTCHVKNLWTGSDHRNSTATWTGTGTDPWPHTTPTTVATNACENCHRPHSAPGRKWLVNAAAEEANCYPCHNGNVAARNIQAEFAKASVHPVATTTGVHDPAEATLVPAGTRHVECVDCHNPHATKAGAGTAGALIGVRGVDIGGAAVATATTEYQICFRCHGDTQTAVATTRQVLHTNIRATFQTTNFSFHPVAGPRNNLSVPSLIAPWTTSSTMKCTDCHNNNTGPGAGGAGPNGPHGSTNVRLLERTYVTTDPAAYSVGNYALCFKCHSSTSIMGNASFTEHSLHINSQRTPCNTCHDPHGVGGGTANNRFLINFNTVVVKPNGAGLLRWESRPAPAKGRCYLLCHTKDHNPLGY